MVKEAASDMSTFSLWQELTHTETTSQDASVQCHSLEKTFQALPGANKTDTEADSLESEGLVLGFQATGGGWGVGGKGWGRPRRFGGVRFQRCSKIFEVGGGG